MVEETTQSGTAELLRALGTWCAEPSVSDSPLSASLGLPALSTEQHTSVFVLSLPPYAAIHLGAEGKLGGSAEEAVAGFFRALDLVPPPEPDHLAALFGLAAHLGAAEAACATDAAKKRLRHARAALFGEYLASWVPSYLAAVEAHGPAADWARLTRAVLTVERRALGEEALGAGRLAALLAQAPPPIAVDDSLDSLLDALVAPVRVGFVLTLRNLETTARATGAGLRRGERRFILRSLLEQAPAATLSALAGHAAAAAARHDADADISGTKNATWWSTRARVSAAVLGTLSTRAR